MNIIFVGYMISDIYKEDKKVKIRWKYCLFRLMTLYIGYGTKNVVVIKEWKLSIDLLCGATSKEQGWRTVVRALASHQSQWPKFKSWRRRHMWFEFVFGFVSCSKRFFYGYSGFPFFSKTNAALPNSNSFWNAWTRFNLSTYYNLPSQLWVAIKLTAASDLPCMKTSKVETAKGCFFPQIWKI